MNIQEGFGSISPSELIELRKALAFNTPTPATGGEGYGWPLVPQDIEAVLAMATIRAKQIRFYQAIPKPDELLGSAVYEYTRQQEIGYDVEPFVTEGVLPFEHVSQYKREFTRAKYMATLRRVTDVMASVNTIGGADAVTRESVNGTIHLLAQVERGLFHADESLNPAAFNGVFATIRNQFAENIVDLRGAEMSVDTCLELTAQLVNPPRYAFPQAMWLSPSALVSLGKESTSQLLYFADPTNPQQYRPAVGALPRGFMGAHGEMVVYEPDIFLEPEFPRSEASVGDAPEQTFSVTPAVVDPGPGETSQFAAGDAGDYIYGVAAVGPGGRSAIAKTAAQTVAAGKKVTLTIAKTGGSVNDITYYQVFRTRKGETKLWLIGGIAYNGGVASVTFSDLNDEIAGTSKALILEYDPTVIQFKRLLPLIRIPFAKIDLSVRFAVALFGMPVIETPTKILCIKNIASTQK